MFVGGLPHGVTDEQIKQFFSRYGMVKEFKMMYDENKQRPRGNKTCLFLTHPPTQTHTIIILIKFIMF